MHVTQIQSIVGQVLASRHIQQTLCIICALVRNFANLHNCISMFYELWLEQVPGCTTHTNTHGSSTYSLVWGSLMLTPIIFVTVKNRKLRKLLYGNNKTSQYFMWTHPPRNVFPAQQGTNDSAYLTHPNHQTWQLSSLLIQLVWNWNMGEEFVLWPWVSSTHLEVMTSSLTTILRQHSITHLWTGRKCVVHWFYFAYTVS